MFAKHELKEALAGITRFSGDVNKVFESIASLIHGDYEEAKLRNTLRLMVRPAHESLSIIMNKVMSCFMALYQIKHQNMAPDRMKSRVEAHCIDAITCVITPECKAVYERYRRTMVDNGEVFSLMEIVDFISTVETSNVNCSWQVARNLPLAVSTLDYTSLALDVKTDMAIHMSQMTPGYKPKEYKDTGAKTKLDDRGRPLKKYDKFSADKKDKRSYSKDKNSTRKTNNTSSRSSSTQSTGKTYSRDSSKGSYNRRGRSSLSGDRRNSKSPARGGGFPAEMECLRCGSSNHKALECKRFKDYCSSRCEDCGLYHETRVCNQRRTNYKSPRRSGKEEYRGEKVDNKAKRINKVEIEEATNSIVFVEPSSAEDATSSLCNNLFRNERKN